MELDAQVSNATFQLKMAQRGKNKDKIRYWEQEFDRLFDLKEKSMQK